MARSLGEFHIAADDGFEHQLLEMALHLIVNLIGKAQTTVEHRQQEAFNLELRIEAALDDANVDRFAGYLHKLTKNTQFIVITHRRGTMNAADRLFGITMQEKGVSALVSVNLIEAQLDD